MGPASQAPGPAPALSSGAVALVAVGGAGGALARTALVEAAPPALVGWVVLAENAVGALLLAALLTLLARGRLSERVWRPLLATGLFGAFTTFSGLARQVVDLSGQGRPALAVGYVAATLGLGLPAAALGAFLARRATSRPPRLERP